MPTGETFCCDLYMEDGPHGGDGSYITMPAEEAYGGGPQGYLYVDGRLKVFQGLRVGLRVTEHQ